MAKSDEEKEIDDNKDKDKVKPSDLEEETKLSRLFYLQLYSSVLNAERENERREKLRRRKQLFQDAKKKVVKSLSWMDVSNLLSRSISSTEQDKDIGDIEVNNTHLSRVLSIVEVPAQYFQSVMIDRRMTTSSKGAGGGPRYGAGQAAGSRNPIVYGSNSGYGQHHYIKSPGGPPEYQVYGQSQGYIMGYDRPNSSVASRLQREVETVSASSGSVNDRRRNNRGALEQVVESESTDGSRGRRRGVSPGVTRGRGTDLTPGWREAQWPPGRSQGGGVVWPRRDWRPTRGRPPGWPTPSPGSPTRTESPLVTRLTRISSLLAATVIRLSSTTLRTSASD